MATTEKSKRDKEILQSYYSVSEKIAETMYVNKCESCGVRDMVYTEGRCQTCLVCGWSKCEV